jgi:hypothetical protein
MDICQSRLSPLASLVENEKFRLTRISLPVDCVSDDQADAGVLIFL